VDSQLSQRAQETSRGLLCESPALLEPTFARVLLQDLKRLLEGLPREYTEEVVRYNLRLVENLGRTDRIVPLLQSLLADEPLLAKLAGSSYRHTNHFDKIVLVDSDDLFGYRLTLHLWDPPYSEADATDEQIHDHRFSFWSHVLAGTLTSQNYVRSGAGNAYNEYRYIPQKQFVSTVGNFYQHIGNAKLDEIAPSRLGAGASYHLFYQRIHRIVLPRRTTTCTLVLRGCRERNHASVFSNSRQYQPLHHTMFSTDELTSRISRMAAVIQRARLRWGG
jgi:hypothetical protein